MINKDEVRNRVKNSLHVWAEKDVGVDRALNKARGMFALALVYESPEHVNATVNAWRVSVIEWEGGEVGKAMPYRTLLALMRMGVPPEVSPRRMVDVFHALFSLLKDLEMVTLTPNGVVWNIPTEEREVLIETTNPERLGQQLVNRLEEKIPATVEPEARLVFETMLQ